MDLIGFKILCPKWSETDKNKPIFEQEETHIRARTISGSYMGINHYIWFIERWTNSNIQSITFTFEY